MPAPRVAVSQRIRIQAPKIAGISRRRNELSKFEAGLISQSTVTQRQASSQQAAIRKKKDFAAMPSLPAMPESSIQAAT